VLDRSDFVLSIHQLAKHIRRMGVSTVVIGSNIIRPTPRNMKETTYDRNKKKINKELNKVKESGNYVGSNHNSGNSHAPNVFCKLDDL
jgi:hypothetical protein